MTPYSTAVRGVLVRHYRGRNGAQRLAQDAQASYRAACNWLQGLNAPSGENLICLMARCEDLVVAIDKIVQERKQQR